MGTGQEQVKRELLLDGLDCANCALKIENGVKKLRALMNAPSILLLKHYRYTPPPIWMNK